MANTCTYVRVCVYVDDEKKNSRKKNSKAVPAEDDVITRINSEQI